MDALPRAIPELHLYLSEIVLAELSRKPFETHHRPSRLRAKRGDQIIERGLAAFIPRLSCPSQDLQRRHVARAGVESDVVGVARNLRALVQRMAEILHCDFFVKC